VIEDVSVFPPASAHPALRASLSPLVILTHKSRRLDRGRSGWAVILIVMPHSPNPSPRVGGIASDHAGPRGEGPTACDAYPGRRSRVTRCHSLPLPWATFPGPFRAENWLASRVSGGPRVQHKSCGKCSAPRESAKKPAEGHHILRISILRAKPSEWTLGSTPVRELRLGAY
jgi:hypothetical protein